MNIKVSEKVSSEDQDTDARKILSLTVEMLGDGRVGELDDECAPWRPSCYLYFSTWICHQRERERERWGERERQRASERERVNPMTVENNIL
jgi:hypothetical protein